MYSQLPDFDRDLEVGVDDCQLYKYMGGTQSTASGNNGEYEGYYYNDLHDERVPSDLQQCNPLLLDGYGCMYFEEAYFVQLEAEQSGLRATTALNKQCEQSSGCSHCTWDPLFKICDCLYCSKLDVDRMGSSNWVHEFHRKYAEVDSGSTCKRASIKAVDITIALLNAISLLGLAISAVSTGDMGVVLRSYSATKLGACCRTQRQ
jgi:hypothetical protein